jgi:hypothetical protein
MLLAILGLLPAIPHIVMGIEKMFGHSSGAAKKQAAMSTIGDLLNALAQQSGDTTAAANSPMMAFVDSTIEGFVKLFNDTGTFTHATK